MKDRSLVEIRPGVYMKHATKNLVGFNKTLQRRLRASRSSVELTLAVKGTFDNLVEGFFSKISKKTRKEHALDKGYFKEVFILSESGKKRLEKLKNKKSL